MMTFNNETPTRATSIEPAIWADADTLLVANGQSLTAKEIRERVSEKKEELSKTGFHQRTYVPLVATQSPESLIQLLAAWNVAATPVLLNPRWPDSLRAEALDAMGVSENAAADSRESFPDGGAVVFTSGSMGTPKAVALTRSNLAANASRVAEHLDFRRGDRWLLSLPLFHVGGLGIVTRSLLVGAPIVLAEPGGDLLSAIQEDEITHVSLVATQLYRLLEEPGGAEALAQCRAVVLGGGPTPQALLERAIAAGISLYNSYGMTETASMVCCTRPGDNSDQLGTAGPPLTPDSVTCSAEGEILVAGPTLCGGYIGRNGELTTPFDHDGWFSTGDLGDFDDAGCLHITGRKDNRFVCGGENIQPEEIEAALLKLPGIEQAVVLPIEDREYGFRPAAVIKAENPREISASGLRAALRDRLPGLKIPSAFYRWPDEAEHPSFKVSRAELAKNLANLEEIR